MENHFAADCTSKVNLINCIMNTHWNKFCELIYKEKIKYTFDIIEIIDNCYGKLCKILCIYRSRICLNVQYMIYIHNSNVS